MERGVVARYVACALCGLYLMLLIGPARPIVQAASFPDSSSYVRVAERGPFSIRFWFDERPPVYPLFLWLLDSSPTVVVVVQAIVWCVAWCWLCTTVWSQIESRLVAVATIALLFAVAVQGTLGFWNTLLLTEGLSASLAVMMITAWWNFVVQPIRFRAAIVALVTATWMLIRDSNAVSLFVMTVPALTVVTVLCRRSSSTLRHLTGVALAVAVCAGLFSLAGQLASDRGETSFHNNVGLRWLGDPEMRSYFVDHGMPMSTPLLARVGHDAWADGATFLTAPELAEYRDWAIGPGRRAAAISAVTKADWWVARFDTEWPTLERDYNVGYDVFGAGRRLPENSLGALAPTGSKGAASLWGLLSAVSIGVVWHRQRALGLLLGLLVSSAVIDVYVSFVGDAVEVSRHLVGPMLRWTVAVILATAVGLDRLLAGPLPAYEADVVDARLEPIDAD